MRLVSPLLFIHCLWRTAKDGGWQYAKERLGFPSRDDQSRIHIHAASVGEVITVLPLIESLQEQQPTLSLLITTNTPTGAAVLKKRLDGDAVHCYLPIDFAGSTARFFKRKNISELWVVETEIWPWLFARAKLHSIPIKIINARLSPKSLGKIAQFFSATYQSALTGVHVLARSSDDAQRYIDQGAEESQVQVIGNLKLAQTQSVATHDALLETKYMLAASTHGDEEIQLAQAWLDSDNAGLLVIVPRHAERGARIAKGIHVLQQEYDANLPPPALRSLKQQPTPICRFYIADTLGELQQWYAHASAAFVGGSLIRHGGHNVLEPARTNTLIIVGPHIHNFSEEVNSLKEVNAIALANNSDEVIELFALATSEPKWATTLSNNAYALVNKESLVIDAYSKALI